MSSSKKGNLSKNLLQMKFMQRSVLRLEKEQNEEERRKIIDDEHWVRDWPSKPQTEEKFIKDQTYSFCEELVFGRQSYKGFNPEIEKLMVSENVKKDMAASDQKEKQNSVSDKEMAKRYSTLMGVIAKKFSNKRKKNDSSSREDDDGPSDRKFIKPSDD